MSTATGQVSKPQTIDALLKKRRPLVMGILNITPDSFSDGGQFVDPATAISHARQMVADGADILDLGAESTRPYGGMKPVSYIDEVSRLSPIVGAVLGLGRPCSIDTLKAKTAEWALDQGVSILNDVWGLQGDPDMAKLAARRHTPIVCMHNRQSADPNIDIIADVLAFFGRTLEVASQAGVAREQIVLDPGIGFGKTPEQSIACIAHFAEFKTFGLPLLLGASRKRFIASVSPSEPRDRIGGSLASLLHAVRHGADIVRVHDVAETVQALRVEAALQGNA
ncbi:MAG: dihydropteroate synthase [Pseudolabrys sp.]|nr:dihydropteroate synthase [Pseudolabrys sp.]